MITQEESHLRLWNSCHRCIHWKPWTSSYLENKVTSNFQIDTVCVSSRKPRVPLATVLFNKTSSRFSGVAGPQQSPPPTPNQSMLSSRMLMTPWLGSSLMEIRSNCSHMHIFSPLLFLMPIWWLKNAQGRPPVMVFLSNLFYHGQNISATLL